jgi:hypothetical protein
MLFLPIIPLSHYVNKSFRSPKLGFFVTLPLLLRNLLQFDAEH